MNIEELKEILHIFREEAREITDHVTADLLALETTAPADQKELLENLFRSMHTLKGGAGSLGIDDVAALAHTAETLLGQCRRGERNYQPVFTDALLASLDEVGRRLDALLAGQTESGEGVRAAQARLSRAIEGEAPIAEQAAAAANGGTSRAAPSEMAFLKVGANRIESLSLAVDEFLVSRLRVAQRASESTRLASELELLARRARFGWGEDQMRELKRITRDAAAIGRELSQETQSMAGMSEDLRESLRGLQVIPASAVLDPFRRSVREHAQTIGVETVFDIVGSEVTADRRILEALRGPLVHLLRNAVDHGIETPAVRKKAGKAPRAKLRVEVSVVGSELKISVTDDGRGINPARLRQSAAEKGLLTAEEAARLDDENALALIWRSGFSTAEKITQTSGRGVGLDAVREDIVKLGGRVEVQSRKGEGATFLIQVPLMLAAAVGLLVVSAGIPYLVPLTAVEVVRRIRISKLERFQGTPVLPHGDRQVPVVGLAAALSGVAMPLGRGDENPMVCVVGDGIAAVALVVDGILGEREMSIRPLGPELQRFEHLAGAARTGDGRVVLVLNVPALIARALELSRAGGGDGRDARTVLIVEDAITSRLLYRAFLEAAGYRVLLSGDGEEALELLQSRPVDAVVSDVRMPRMDGLELTRRIRRLPGMERLPVLLVTSLDSSEDRAEGMRAGATTYLVKGETPPERVVDVLSGFVA